VVDASRCSRKRLDRLWPRFPILEYLSTRVTSPILGSARTSLQRGVNELGGVHALVTYAASYEPVSFVDITAESWDRILDVVLRGSVLPAVAASRWMASNGGGRIVLVSSVGAIVAEPETASYSAAKAAISSVARSIAVELSGLGVVANAVVSGWIIRTPMNEEYLRSATSEYLRRINMLARAATPEEVAGVVSYLLTEAPAFLTGAALTVDGGQTALAPLP
jgi:NAD(P)-dependent dehydrogenase (short-subunit alcohol dehydrogenase family)